MPCHQQQTGAVTALLLPMCCYVLLFLSPEAQKQIVLFIALALIRKRIIITAQVLKEVHLIGLKVDKSALGQSIEAISITQCTHNKPYLTTPRYSTAAAAAAASISVGITYLCIRIIPSINNTSIEDAK